MFKVISGTLLANRNTIEFTDETISNNSIFEVYADQPDVIPVSVTVGGTTASITFDAKASVNTGIKILVNNIEGEFAPDTIDAENVTYTTDVVPTVENAKDGMDQLFEGFVGIAREMGEGFEDVYEKLADDDTVLGGVLYHATTGNTWKKLDASNIDYDSGSTIYSAMGDIDDLTTTATNIVSAINEVNSKPSGGAISYSTTEFDTGKTWIDGKKIYCKVLTGTSLSAGNNNISVRDLQIDVPVNIFMNVKVTLNGNTRWRPVPFSYWLNNASDSSWYGGVFYNYPEDTINAQLGPSLVNGVNAWFIIVEYTKRS